MKETIWILGAAIVCLGLSVVRSWADTVYLKDDKVLVGMIDSASSDSKKLVIRTANVVLQIPRDKIKSIEQYPNISYTEASGDLAASENNLDRAYELYQKAMQSEGATPRLKDKLTDLKKKIDARDQRNYGSLYREIEQAIAEQHFNDAIALARNQIQRVNQASAKKRFQQLVAQAQIGVARQFRNHIQYPEAENYYTLAMQSAPDGPLARLELADMLQSSPTRKADAIPLYEEGIRLAQNQEDAITADQLLGYRFRLGQLVYDQKDYFKAAQLFLSVTRDDKKFQYPQAIDLAVDSYAKAQASGTQQDMGDVIQNLEAITVLKPTDERAFLLLGRLFFDQKNWVKSRDNLLQAVKNAQAAGQTLPLQEALYYLGVSYTNLNQLTEAGDTLQQLANMQSGNYDAICQLAEIRLKQLSYSAAAELFRKALDLDKDKYRAYLGLGQACQKLQQFDQARENFKAVVARAPEHADAQLAIAQTYAEQKQWNDVIREAKETIDRVRGKTSGKLTAEDEAILDQAWLLTGRANLEAQNTHSARDAYQKALEVMPNDAAALDGIGKTYQAEGLHKSAEEFFNKAIQVDPKNPDYYLSMGINWHKYRMSPDKALPFFMKYVELGGKDPNVRTWIKECGGTPPPAAQ